MRSTSEYRLSEVAAHDNGSSCWVIVHGQVIDVTDFLSEHPGGRAALAKVGRAGRDVTAHFERIGHSADARARLQTMCIGRVAPSETPEDDAPRHGEPRASGSSPSPRVAHELPPDHGVAWHGARRAAILQAHPEVGDLFGHNPWTPIVGLLASATHAAVALKCGTRGSTGEPLDWLAVLALAYTIGAFLKMVGFAVCHDICHGTAGEWCEARWMRRLLIHVCTLPSFGGETQHYYQLQHIGHHVALGDAYSPWRATTPFSLDEMDGDLSSPSSMLMMISSSIGVQRASKRVRSALDPPFAPTAKPSRVAPATNAKDTRRRWLWWLLGRWLDPAAWRFRLLAQPLMHSAHLLMLTSAQILIGAIVNPVSIVVTFTMALAPASWGRAAVRCCIGTRGALVLLGVRSADADGELGRELLWDLLGLGLHTWLWATALLLLCFAGGGWGAALYLLLSELFLHGFCFHPYAGFFLGVHRSELSKGREAECQPTMSTYSTLASWATLNLTHHVEHHDFPSVPWSRLPDVTKAAPEFYARLDASPGFSTTIWRWLHSGSEWHYACFALGESHAVSLLEHALVWALPGELLPVPLNQEQQ
jgi:fatty acid desaturase